MTTTDATQTLECRILTAKIRQIRTIAAEIGLGELWLYDSFNINDNKPRNPTERRQAAITCILYRYYGTNDRQAITDAYKALHAMGRTKRWHVGIDNLIHACEQSDADLDDIIRWNGFYTARDCA